MAPAVWIFAILPLYLTGDFRYILCFRGVERGRGMGYNVVMNRWHVNLGFYVRGRRKLGYYVGSWGRGC